MKDMVKVTVKPDRRPPLPPDGRELFDYVRASVPRKGNAPPPAFVEATARIAALEDALAAERSELQGLIRAAYDRGVPQSTLARWAGYTPRWVASILRLAA